MLQRIFLLTLVAVAVLSVRAQEEVESEADVRQTEPLAQDERPRGERAEAADLPPPRRQRQ